MNFLGDSLQFSMICEPLWNFSGVIHCNLWTTLKWFWGDSQTTMTFFQVILGDLQTTLKWFWANFWWFTNHSEFFFRWFLVICEPLWNDSGVICKPILNDAWIIKNPFASVQIIHSKKEEELIFQNISDLSGCMRIL